MNKITKFLRKKVYDFNFKLEDQNTGLLKDPLDPRDYVYNPPVLSDLARGDDTPIPEGTLIKVSKSFMPVMNQGSSNACTGYAGAAYIAAIGSNLFQDKLSLQANPMYLYYNARKWSRQSALFAGTNPETRDNGSGIRDMMKSMHEHGILVNPPSSPLEGCNVPSAVPSEYTDAEAAKWKVWNYKTIFVNEDAPETMRKRILLDKSPLIVGVRLLNIPGWTSSKQKKIDLPANWESVGDKGNHAVCVLGYQGDYFLIQNSWGDLWHNNGFSFIHEDFFKQTGSATSIWTLDTRWLWE